MQKMAKQTLVINDLTHMGESESVRETLSTPLKGDICA